MMGLIMRGEDSNVCANIITLRLLVSVLACLLNKTTQNHCHRPHIHVVIKTMLLHLFENLQIYCTFTNK